MAHTPYVWMGLDHVQLAAPEGCEAKARHYFGELLGMKEVEKPERLKTRGGVWFQCGPQMVHIGVENGFSPAKKAHPAFLVRGIEALMQRLAENGIRFRLDEDIPGTIRFFTEDPFGNRLEFMEARDHAD